MNEWAQSNPLSTKHLHTMQQRSSEESRLGKEYEQKKKTQLLTV